MKKIYIVGGNRYLDYINWILPLGYSVTKDLNESDLVFFAGGDDVSPKLYGEVTSYHVYSNNQRDKEEIEIFYASGNKPKIGVCRGGQFLTVMNGYKLVQHMSHPGSHLITTIDGDKIQATSSHHNQFLLQENGIILPSPYSLIAWAEKLSPMHLNGENKDYNFPDNYKEPEIVYCNGIEYGRGKCLLFQMHPEWLPLDHPTVKYCQNLLLDMLNDKL